MKNSFQLKNERDLKRFKEYCEKLSVEKLSTLIAKIRQERATMNNNSNYLDHYYLSRALNIVRDVEISKKRDSYQAKNSKAANFAIFYGTPLWNGHLKENGVAIKGISL